MSIPLPGFSDNNLFSRQNLGNAVDLLGTTLGWNGIGLSETLAGAPTINTGRIDESGLATVTKRTDQKADKPTDDLRDAPTGIAGSANLTDGSNVTYSNSPTVSQPTYNPETVQQLDQSIALINDALSRLGTQLGVAKGNIGDQYQTSINELNSSKSSNKNQFDQSSTTNQQNLRTNRNAILDQQSTGLRGLMRQLGAYGAVGSDMGVASGVVQDVAQRDMSGAGQTYAQNQRGLDTNWNSYLSEWANSKKKADDWKRQQLQGVEQQSLTSKQSLLSQLADLRGNRTAALGGNYTQGAQADLDQARSLSGQIDQLGRFNPSYNGNTPTYKAPDLSSYTTPQMQQADVSNLAGNSAANPSLALLLGLDERKRR